MANYQNNMRYGRQGNMRPMPGRHTGYQSSAPQADARCCDPAPQRNAVQREDCGCCAPETDRMRREDCGCRAPEMEARGAAECRERKMPKSCGRMMEDPLYGMPLAMAYVPWQTWCQISDLCEGFRSGTIFEELNKPFLGRGGWKR